MDLYNLSSRNIETFISQEIQPDDAYIASCNAVVDRLVRFLQNNVPAEIRPSEVIKGGSLGKGTAVKGKSDIDLAMMMASYNTVEKLMRDMGTILQKLQDYLGNYGEVKVVGKTPYAVQVELSCHKGHTHSVDILPAVSILPHIQQREQLKASLRSVFEELGSKDPKTRAFLSVSLCPLQLELTRRLPTKLKSLIRLIKYWKKEKLQVGQGSAVPTSYVLELVVLNAWISAGQPERFDMVRAVHAVLITLENHHQFKVVFDVAFYERQRANITQEPYIMDPCNPYNDVYNGHFGKPWDWAAVAKEAKRWLSMPLFAGVSNTRTQW